MESQNSSRTAVLTAIHRAAHYILDDDPKILADRFARSFAGFASDEDLLAALATSSFPDFAAHRALFALRNRFTEDALTAAVELGTAQYVILGAGLDSFAHRQPPAMRALRIYEVDHPASQSWKRARLAELGIDTPPSLHYLPIDFERQALTAVLPAGGLDDHAPTFFSWLGVTQYLTRDAVLNTLRDVASVSAPGSELALTFVIPAAMLGPSDREIVDGVAAMTAGVGEPWLSFFEPRDMEDLMRQAGFEDIHVFGREQASERYLAGRGDGLEMPAYSRFIKGRLGTRG
jgi:methyltransferase (TIGR00027 family)